MLYADVILPVPLDGLFTYAVPQHMQQQVAVGMRVRVPFGRNKHYVEAERYARRAVEAEPRLYVAWETLGATLLDAKGNLDEAEAAVRKACELSKDKDGRDADVRMLITLARVQLARGDAIHGKTTLRMVQKRIDELSAFERSEFEELRKSAK